VFRFDGKIIRQEKDRSKEKSRAEGKREEGVYLFALFCLDRVGTSIISNIGRLRAYFRSIRRF